MTSYRNKSRVILVEEVTRILSRLDGAGLAETASTLKISASQLRTMLREIGGKGVSCKAGIISVESERLNSKEEGRSYPTVREILSRIERDGFIDAERL